MNKTILIIDDDPILRLIVQKMIFRFDNSLMFVPCENGKIGLDKLNNLIEASSNCIILLDLNMPVLDGWGFLEEVQSSLSDHHDIPLYILSSSTDQNDMEKAMNYKWVRKYFHKPLNSNNIRDILSSD